MNVRILEAFPHSCMAFSPSNMTQGSLQPSISHVYTLCILTDRLSLFPSLIVNVCVNNKLFMSIKNSAVVTQKKICTLFMSYCHVCSQRKHANILTSGLLCTGKS